MKKPAANDKDAAYEELRLEALDSYKILDTPFEQEFDDVVNLAAHICQTPIALISFIDRERQWFKAAHGLDVRETDRRLSFCAHAIQGTETFIVPDATRDDRFKDNAAVTGAANVVFYAGAPIVNEDHLGLGSLCVIDHQARELSAEQLECLRALGRQVTRLLAIRKQGLRSRELSSKIETHLISDKVDLQQKFEVARAAADRAEAEYRAIFDSLAIGVAQLDPNTGKIERCNQTYAQMLGFGEDELRGMTVHELTHPEDRSRNVDHFNRLADSRDQVLKHEKRYVRKDGSPLWVRTTAVLVRANDGTPLHITGVISDISAERSAINEMTLHRETLMLATDAGRIGVWDWDMVTNKMIMNATEANIYGVTSTIVDSADLFSRIHPEDLPGVEIEVAASIAGRTPYRGSFRVIRDSGETRHLLASGSCIFDANGNATRMVGVNIDETDNRAAAIERAQLEVQARSAIESSRLKSEFLANMSHEIRTPINGIVGMTKLLQDTEQTAEQKRFTSAINTSSSILLTLINDILDLSKVESGKLNLEIVPFNARELVQNLRDSFETLFQAKGVMLEINFATEDEFYFGDPSRIRQILNNLLGNALKFTPRGKVAVEVTGQLHFRVSDTGIGISENVCRNIFEKFVQGDASTARKFGGSGLGLAISKHLCNLMNGDIEVESNEGKGSVFSFHLPLPLARREDVRASASETDTEAMSKTAREKFRILVAEDNLINQEITLRMLKKAGYRADAVVNGVEVLTSMVTTPYDLILMDCQMPEMDGFEATRQLRKKGFKLPIVALTANAYQEDKDACLASGMSEYLSKPVPEPALLAMVDRMLDDAMPTSAAPPPAVAANSAPPAAPRSNESSLNLNQLRDLQVLDPDGKDGFVQHLITSWMEAAPRAFNEMRSADAKKRGNLAHSLKSTSANLGAVRVATILKAIEAAKFEESELPGILAALAEEIEIASAELREYVARLDQQRAG